MYRDCMRGSLNPKNLVDCIKFNINEFREHPYYFRTFGTCIFCGPQGSGKTLSAVDYVVNIRAIYPRAILVSNIAISDFPFNTELRFDDEGNPYLFYLPYFIKIDTDWILEHCNDDDFQPITIEYTGLEMLKFVNNNEYGVVFLIDELHLELNSLESKNIDIEVMVEISQQRKQRKHIVGTSQVFMRLAKPLREQIHDVILCNNYFKYIQFNKWINGETATEENGKLVAEIKGRFIWFHSPKMYGRYDTYVKMKRYNKEWQGHKRESTLFDVRQPSAVIEVHNNKKGAKYLEFSK